MASLKEGTRLLLSFILMVLTIAFIGMLFLKSVLLNAHYINNNLEKSDYYEQVTKDLESNFKVLSMESGVPVEVFMDAAMNEYELQRLSRENVATTVNYLSFENGEYKTLVDRKLFEKPVTEYVNDYAAKNNIIRDDQFQNRTNQIIDEAAQITSSHVQLFNLKNVIGIPQFQKLRTVLHMLTKTFPFLILSIGIVLGLLLILNRKRMYRALLWIGSGIAAGSAFAIIPALIALFNRIPQRISISADYINTAIRSLTAGYIDYFLIAGVAVLVAGIGCLTAYSFLSKAAARKRTKRKHSNEIVQF